MPRTPDLVTGLEKQLFDAWKVELTRFRGHLKIREIHDGKHT